MDCRQEKEKTKKLLCPQSTVSEVFDGSFRAPICKSGTKSSPGLKFSGPRCSQIQKGFNASPFSGPNIAGSASAGMNAHSILNDPEVRSLERLLRVKSKVELRLPGRLLDKPPGFCCLRTRLMDGCFVKNLLSRCWSWQWLREFCLRIMCLILQSITLTVSAANEACCVSGTAGRAVLENHWFAVAAATQVILRR